MYGPVLSEKRYLPRSAEAPGSDAAGAEKGLVVSDGDVAVAVMSGCEGTEGKEVVNVPVPSVYGPSADEHVTSRDTFRRVRTASSDSRGEITG